MAPDNCVKVKRDGPRGWHWIAADSFDPDKHELFEVPGVASASSAEFGRLPPADSALKVSTPRKAKAKK